ncbi:uncharacterized protein [Panulirus ornatus]
MVSGCFLYHHPPSSDHPSSRRLLGIRLSLVSTALVLTLVLVLLRLNEAGVYRWTSQASIVQHTQPLVTPVDYKLNQSGVWMVTTTSVVGTMAALLSLASTFCCRRQKSSSPCLNRVTMLSAGWVYEPSPRPDVDAEKDELRECPDSYEMLRRKLTKPFSSERVRGAIPTITISHSLHTQNIASDDFPNSVGDYNRILCPRSHFFEKTVADETVKDDQDARIGKPQFVDMPSFMPRKVVTRDRYTRPEVSRENKALIPSTSLTQVLRLVQTNTWSSPSVLKTENDRKPLLQETVLRDLSPIPRFSSSFQTNDSITVSTKLLMSCPASSTPEKSSSRGSYPSTSNPTLQHLVQSPSVQIQYSPDRVLSALPTDVSVAEGKNASDHSSSETLNLIHRGAESPIHLDQHGDPSLIPVTSVLPEMKSTSKSASAQRCSSNVISIRFVRERGALENDPSLSNVKTSPALQSGLSAHGRNFSTPQTLLLADERKECSTQLSDCANSGCLHRNQASRMIRTTERCWRPTPPTRSRTTHLTSTFCTSPPSTASFSQ